MHINSIQRAFLLLFPLLLAACGGGGSSSDDAARSVTVPTINSFESSPDTVPSGETVTFTWDVDDLDGNSVTCGLDVENDGTIEYTVSNCQQASNSSQDHTYTVQGDYQVRLVANDGHSAPVEELITVSVVNSAPRILSLDLNPAVPSVGQNVEFSWRVANDIDGDTFSCHLDINGDGTDDYENIGCSPNVEHTLTHVYVNAHLGSRQVILTAVDQHGASNEDDLTISVTNQAPELTSFAPSFTSLEKNNPLTFTWAVSDPNGDTLTCELDVDNDGSSEYTINDCANTLSQEHTYEAVESYVARLQVFDGINNAISVLSDEITVTGNTAPEIETFEVSADLLTVGDSTSFSWTVSDINEEDTLTCSIDINDDGTNDYPSADCSEYLTQSHTYTESGSYTARLTVNDGFEETQDTLTIQVSNSPAISQFLASPDVLLSESETVFSWVVSDSNGDSLTCYLDVDNDGTNEHAIHDCVNNTQFPHTYEDTGDYTAKLTVSDGISADVDTTLSLSVKSHLLVDISANDPVSSGGRAQYTLTVNNASLSPVYNTWVSYHVPEGIEFHGSTDTHPNVGCGSACVEGEDASWSLGTLAAGESQTILLNARVLGNVPDASVISASVTATSSSLVDNVELVKELRVNNSPMSQLALSASHDPVQAGEVFTLTLDIGNIGAGSLNNLELRALLPDGLSAESISDGGSVEGVTGDVVWSLSSLAIEETAQRKVTLRVAEDMPPSRILSLVAELRHDAGLELDVVAEHALTVVAEPSRLRLDLVAASAPVSAGERAAYEFTLSNVSSLPVNNVWLFHRVPSGLAFDGIADAQPDTTCGSSCTEDKEAFWNLGTLAAGEKETISLNVDVLAGVSDGSLINSSVLVTSSDVLDSIHQIKTLWVNNNPVSQLALSASVDPVQVGAEFTLNVDIGNTSLAALNNLELRAQIPTGVTVSSISDGGVQDGGTGEIVWTLSSLAAETAAQRQVTLNAPTDAIPGQLLPFSAELRHDGGPALDAVAENTLSVEGDASPLQLDVAVASTPVMAGGRALYALTVSNVSLLTMDNVILLYRVPAGIEFHGVNDSAPDTSCGTSCIESEEAVWELGNLASGESRTIIVNANVLEDVLGGSLISTTVSVSANHLTEDVSQEVTLQVDNDSVSHLLLSASQDPVQAGDALTVSLDISNTGTESLNNLELRVQLPTGATVNTISDGGSQDGESVVWTLPQLTSLDAARREVSLNVPMNVIAGQALPLTAELRYDGGLAVDKVAEHAVTVMEDESPLSLILNAAPNPVPQTDEVLTYTLTVSNESLMAVNNVLVLFRVPPGIEFNPFADVVPIATCESPCSEADEVVWNLGSLAAGENTEITIDASLLETNTQGMLMPASVTITADELEDTLYRINVVPIAAPIIE